MQNMAVKENKMGVMPMGKLLLGMALPMVASMIVQALYNVVDSIFVSMLGQDELNAVSMAFPIQNIIISIASGLGVGVNALISRSLGEGRRDEANRYAALGVFLSAVSYILMLLFGVFGCEAFFRSQTGVEAIIEGDDENQPEHLICYYSFMQPSFREFRMPEGVRYQAEVIDTWNMTREIAGVFEGRFDVALPGRSYMAIYLKRV